MRDAGDAYMCACGLLEEDPDHALHMVDFAYAMLQAAASVRLPHDAPGGAGGLRIRVGVHSGTVMSGVVGTVRSRYGLFGGERGGARVGRALDP